MRICVFGAGAVGGFLAARLARADNDVSVIARGAHLDAVKSGGIAVRAAADDFTVSVRASDRPSDLGPQDAVFVTLKATALRSFAESAKPLIGAGTAVVFCQNGIPWWYAEALSPTRPQPPDLSRLDPGALLARAVAPEHIVGGVVYSPNEAVAPGIIVNTGAGRDQVLIGEPDDSATERVRRLRAVLVAAGIGSPDVSDIRAAIWRKIMSNLSASALGLLVEKETDVIARDPALHEVSQRLRTEVVAIASAHGVTFQEQGERQRGAPSHHKASLLQDYEAGRPMEIEAIFMAPLAFAQIAKIDVPVLQTVAALAARRAAERGLYAP